MRLNGIRDAKKVVPGTILLVGYGTRSSQQTSSARAPALANAYTQGRKRPLTDARLTPRPNSKRRLSLPIRSGKLVSKFGPRKRSFHDGVDISAPSGTPVYAAHSGVITYAGSRLRGYGKLVIIEGDDSLITVYAHNRKLLVSNGQRVRLGQKIAEVGSTGRSTGPHLHFEVRMRDRSGRLVAIDPLPILRASGRKPRYRVNESLSPLLAKR
ncbi:UNVERIFIED_CONTAM: hypothetical protein GTU68_021371 [Idotea baltica]|nr:hypothetical protein [Idotea baltica]